MQNPNGTTVYYVHNQGQVLGPWDSTRIRDAWEAGKLHPTAHLSPTPRGGGRDIVSTMQFWQQAEAPPINLDTLPSAMPWQGGIVVGEEFHVPPAPVQAQAGIELPQPPYQREITLALDPKPLNANWAKTRNGISPIRLAQPQLQREAAPVAAKPAPKQVQLKAGQLYLESPDGRKVGPLSSARIVKLFQGGKLPAGTVVRRTGSNARMPVKDFVRTYVRGAEKKPKIGRPMRQHLQPLRQLKLQAWALPALAFVTGALVTALIALALK